MLYSVLPSIFTHPHPPSFHHHPSSPPSFHPHPPSRGHQPCSRGLGSLVPAVRDQRHSAAHQGEGGHADAGGGREEEESQHPRVRRQTSPLPSPYPLLSHISSSHPIFSPLTSSPSPPSFLLTSICHTHLLSFLTPCGLDTSPRLPPLLSPHLAMLLPFPFQV